MGDRERRVESSAVPTAEPAPDRSFGWVHRRDRRHLCEFEVTLSDPMPDPPIAGVVKNLSRGGLFLATDRRLGLDTEVALYLPIEREPLPLAGRVVWRRDRRTGAEAGLGIRFEDMSEAERGRLDQLLEILPEEEIESPEVELDYSLADDV